MRAAISGLSPRGRGKRSPFALKAPLSGSIPAWAGETPLYPRAKVLCAVYPRVGGGNGLFGTFSVPTIGLSPRGRGKLIFVDVGVGIWGSIPAWAGETHGIPALDMAKAVYPRVGGGNRARRWAAAWRRGLSPRGRGKPPKPLENHRPRRSIPAWAGETAIQIRRRQARAVYPRVGGGNKLWLNQDPPQRGLSPRGRGKPRTCRLRLGVLRSIPAWAGETFDAPPSENRPKVYPRVGGGNIIDAAHPRIDEGLSPRGRGKRRWRSRRTFA